MLISVFLVNIWNFYKKKRSHVKNASRIDVSSLMIIFTIPTDAKLFYDDVLLQTTNQDNAFNEDEQ